jgi:hypothetical protein
MPVLRALVLLSLCLMIVASTPPSVQEPGQERQPGTLDYTAPTDGMFPPVAQAPSLPGEREMRALAAAYPGRIRAVGIRDGEWALMMDGRWYYWADGAVLPEEYRDRAEEFVNLRFYNYQLGPPVLRYVSPELEKLLRDHEEVLETDTRLRFNGFLDTLYGISSLAEAERTMARVIFLGHHTRVHPWLVKPLQQVNRRIMKHVAIDPEVEAFVNGLDSVHGFNWRNIAGTVRRSYHAYGMAVDLEPRSYGGLWSYWRWASENRVEWWDLPLHQRWHVPRPVIDAFEENGFVWGGKWLQFDNIHFEYRPESIIMATQAGGDEVLSSRW